MSDPKTEEEEKLDEATSEDEERDETETNDVDGEETEANDEGSDDDESEEDESEEDESEEDEEEESDSEDDDEPEVSASEDSSEDFESSAEDAGPEPEPDGIIEVKYFGTTHVGLIREHNEDNLVMVDLDAEVRDLDPDDSSRQTILGERGLVLAVCDGMGGAAAGEVASQMAVDTIHEVMQAGSVVEDRDMLAHRLVFAIEEAGARIFSAAKMDRSRRGMGTTATAAALIDRYLFVGQVGDSRCYLLRKGKLTLITKDQSLVNQLIEAGQLTEEEAEAFEHSNIILQALGTTEEVAVDLTFVELRRGDRIMLCSDGLSGLVHGEMIQEVMEETAGLEDVAFRLIELANAGGGHDNITCIVADFDGDGLGAEEDAPEAGYMQYPLPELDEPMASAVAPREPTLKTGVRKPGADVKRAVPARAAEQPSSSMMPMVIIALIVLAVVAYFMMRDDADTEEVEEVTPTAVENEEEEEEPEAEDEFLEVTIITDVSGAELVIDGTSFGPLDSQDANMLELSPGAYRFEARVGGSVSVSELVTIDAEHTDVALLLPSGELTGIDEESEGELGSTSEVTTPSESVMQATPSETAPPSTQMDTDTPTPMTTTTPTMTTPTTSPMQATPTPMTSTGMSTGGTPPPNPF